MSNEINSRSLPEQHVLRAFAFSYPHLSQLCAKLGLSPDKIEGNGVNWGIRLAGPRFTIGIGGSVWDGPPSPSIKLSSHMSWQGVVRILRELNLWDSQYFKWEDEQRLAQVLEDNLEQVLLYLEQHPT